MSDNVIPFARIGSPEVTVEQQGLLWRVGVRRADGQYDLGHAVQRFVDPDEAMECARRLAFSTSLVIRILEQQEPDDGPEAA